MFKIDMNEPTGRGGGREMGSGEKKSYFKVEETLDLSVSDWIFGLQMVGNTQNLNKLTRT